MGMQVAQHTWTTEQADQTKKSALEHAEQLQHLIDTNFFDKGQLTLGIEQEGYVLNRKTGLPMNVESFIYHNNVGVRPETGNYIVEYDIGKITSIARQALTTLFGDIHKQNQSIQKALQKTYGQDAVLINTGLCPFVFDNWADLVISDEVTRYRYELLEKITVKENKEKNVLIYNQNTGELFSDRATNLSANTRCFATQLHFGFSSFRETLAAYNISVAVTGPLMALFANSPFIAGMNSGFGSARIELLNQCEQKRYRQSKYANSFLNHAYNELINDSPFIAFGTADAWRTTYSGEHITTRIRLDESNGTSRIEIRGMDSMRPERIRNAVVICTGLLFGLRADALPTMEEVNFNFREGRKGVRATFLWQGERFSYQETWLFLLGKARLGLRSIGFLELSEDYISEMEDMIRHNKNDATVLVDAVQVLENDGKSRLDALKEVLVTNI